MIGVAFGTMAFILVLSVFNGLEEMVKSMFNVFDPDLRIESAEGGSFNVDTNLIKEVRNLPEVAYSSEVIEKNVLLEYNGKQVIATMKAVDDNYEKVTGVDTAIYEGNFVLEDNSVKYAVVGYGIAARLGIGMDVMYAIRIWAPLRTKGYTMNLQSAFNSAPLSVAGIFAIQQEIDDKYIIVPIDFARDLMNYGNEATAIEIKLVNGADEKDVQQKIEKILGKDFTVKNRFEQMPLIYKIMRTERLGIIAILSFILLVSSFNIIGTVIMMILEKRKDLGNIIAIGATVTDIRRIFFFQGLIISLGGDILGLIMGVAIALGQQINGWLKFTQDGVNLTPYPVLVDWLDVVIVFVVVAFIGFLVAKYSVRFITKDFIVRSKA